VANYGQGAIQSADAQYRDETVPSSIAGRGSMSGARRIRAGVLGMRHEPPDVRRRARSLIGLSILGLGAVAAIATIILIHSAAALTSKYADERAQHGDRLLVTVGAVLPDLTPRVLSRGLSAAKVAQLDAAVRHGQRAGLLSDLKVWNRQGKLIYAGYENLERLGASRSDPALVKTLQGPSVSSRNPTGLDLSSGRRTGTLDAYDALRDSDGHIYGAIETELPLLPILAQSGTVRTDILVFFMAGSALLWLLLLPLTARAALGIARAWIPGRRRIINDFRRALTEDEIELVYQPQIDPTDQTVYGLEALVRWRRHGKLRAPDTFLPAIEQSALITALTDRVIDLAAAQLAIWRQAGHTLRLSVNLSARDLEDDQLAARIDAALSRHAIPSDQLTVEVTETAILQDIECAQRELTAVRQLGVEIAIDDFGTGHASISRLHRFPVQELKIDRSFVTPVDERTRSYLTAMVRFGQGLGLRVVAEGVEDAPTLAYLELLSCDLAQGYHIARPLATEQVQVWLAEHQPIPAPPRLLVPAVL
jgi:EAL domain-containing protein (putative c-di-GMP-specific phosphodiesterase class I)